MNREDKLALGIPLVLLIIAVVFASLAITLVNSLASKSVFLVYVLSSIVVFFFAVLAIFGLILAIVMLLYWIRRYSKPVKREVESAIHRRQISPQYNPHSRQAYKIRHPRTRRQPPDNT
jgi:uncharacterized membrane protein YGL010W